MPPRIPDSLRFGSLTFRVNRLGDCRLCFAYKEGSKWRYVKRQTIDELREEANRIGTAILNADSASLQLSADDARIHVAARDLLSPHGLAIDAAARIVDESAKLLGGAHRIVEAARWFSRSNAHGAPASIEIGQAITEFILTRKARGLTNLYVHKLEADLLKFAEAFPGPVSLHRSGALEQWITSRLDRNERPIGARRQRKLRDNIITLYNWLRDRNYLPEGFKHEAEKVARVKLRRNAVDIYTVAEMRTLLEHANADEFPALTIAAFAGLRTEEIMRLEWSDVRFDQGVILLPGSKTKTGEPRAPKIRENLAQWLAPYAKRTGFIIPCVKGADRPQRLDNFLRSLKKRAGVKSRRNGFRHSFGSYLCAVTRNFSEVSFEMGNTPAVIRKAYFEAVSETEGKAWSDLRPPDTAKVIPMSASLE